MPLSETARKQGALWGAEARDWTEIQERTAPLLWRAALDAAGVGSGTRLLDAGCGAGGASVAARERGAIVSGCDASEPLLAIARERLPDADLRLGELENLPFPDRAFDVVLAINCMQFTRDPLRAAQDLVRVTGPAARIVVVVWSIDQCEQRQIFDAVLRKGAVFSRCPGRAKSRPCSPLSRLKRSRSRQPQSIRLWTSRCAVRCPRARLNASRRFSGGRR